MMIYKLFVLGIPLLFHSCTAHLCSYVEQYKNRKTVAKAFEQWQQGTGSFFDLLDEQVEWRVCGNGRFSGTYQGKKLFMEKALIPINDQLATKLKPDLIHISAEANIVWLHWQGTATTKAGSVYQNEYAWKLEFNKRKIVKAVAFLDMEALDNLFTSNSNTMQSTIEDTKEYIGMWVTKDGNIRHELLPNSRYDEARGNRKSAYQGAYTVSGNHIYYTDDTGFTADGEFKEGILYHAGMILYKEN